MTAATTFHLVRHAAHDLLPHTLAGRAPVPLNAEGRAQAAALPARLPRPDLVLTSPTARAVETAAFLAAAGWVSEPPFDEPGFDEIDFGAWAGQRFDALDPDPAWRRWNAARAAARCPGGESMIEAQARAMAAIERWRTARPGQAIAVVSHADVIKAVLAASLGLSLDHLHRFIVAPASISTVVAAAGGMHVERVNF